MLEENKDDFKESIIERGNLTNTFTVSSIETHLKSLEKMEKEGEAQLGLSKATCENVLKNNSFIKKMKPEDIHACHMYHEHFTTANEIEPQLVTVKEEIAKHKEYLEIIYDLFGFVKTEAPNTPPEDDK